MPSLKVLLTDQVFPSVELERGVLASLGAELEVADGTLEDVRRRAHTADAVLNTYLSLGPDDLALFTRCKVIARYGIGVDNIDLAAARSMGIAVTNVPDYCIDEVATHALAMLLSLLRQLPAADRIVQAGEWETQSIRPIQRMSETTIGLVGYGRIARRLAEALVVLGARIVVHDPFLTASADLPPLLELDELLAQSDAVSLHVPMSPETRNLIDERRLGLMKPTGVLVNTSRGGLVDVKALASALTQGTLRAAALDVLPLEPGDVPIVKGIPNLLLTPHMAYYSEQSLVESQTKAVAQVVKVLSGESADYVVN